MKFKGLKARKKGRRTGDLEVARPKKRPKVKKSKLLKQIKLPKKSEFVLTIGDEGAVLTHIKKQILEGRWFASEPSEANIEIFNKAVANDIQAPITVVLDTMDQHYSQQTLPPVSKMSLSGLLKRRAQKEFGKDIELQGNYFLSRSDTKEWEYMMYALEITEQIKPWMDWAKRQPNHPRGVRVLPLEAAVMMKALAERRPANEGEAHSWQYLVTYNKVSGVRQVILRDGEMVFTRLGQPLEGDANTEAGVIEQEVVSTVEYLKRIGLKSIHDLRLYVVAAQEIIDVMDVERMGVRSNVLLSPHRAAEDLALDAVVQDSDRYGDILIATFVASYKKSKHVLWTRALVKIRNLYMGVPVIRAVGALAVLGLLAYTGYSGYQYWSSSSDLNGFEQKRNSLDQQVVDLQKQANMPKEQLEKILETHDIYKSIKNKQTSPKDFMLNIAWAMSSLPRHMRIQSITWKQSEGKTNNNASANAQGAPPSGTAQPVEGTLNINILVPATIKREALEKRANEVIGKLKPYFPYYEIELTELPEARSLSDSVNISVGINSQEPESAEEELRRVTLKTKFSGVDYVPEPRFEGRL